MEYPSVRDVERQRRRPGVVAVRERQPWDKSHQNSQRLGDGTDSSVRHASFIQHYVTSRVLKLPTLLNLRIATATITVPLAAENIHCLKHHDVWRLRRLVVLSRVDLIIKFGGGQGCQIRSVRRGYRNPIS